jgi:uncharacterized linocin/CFP29 family protein
MMDPAIESLGWTEEQWNRICAAVSEEAQKARVAAQVLPVVGPEDPDTVAIPRFEQTTPASPNNLVPPSLRLAVDSNPTINLTTISVNVQLRGHEVADPALTAALSMFRRAATWIARLEDMLLLNGRSNGPNPVLRGPAGQIPSVYTLSADGVAEAGIFNLGQAIGVPLPRRQIRGQALVTGQGLFDGIVAAIGALEAAGQLGPFACLLGPTLFQIASSANRNFVLPRDRILPFLQGPLLRSSAAATAFGAVISLAANPVEIVAATDIGVQFVQKTPEPRCIFRVCERVALRVKDWNAIAIVS